MNRKICKIFFCVFICCINMLQINAQNYTGTWAGETDGAEFLQLNIVQIGTTICGYSWDYDLENKRSYCKANFSGYINNASKNCFVTGTSFIQNSGSHALMNIKFTLVYQDGYPMLQGACQIKATMFSSAGAASYFLLKKMSKSPTLITNGMKACLPPVKEPIVKIKVPKLNTVKKPIVKTNKPNVITVPKPITKPIVKSVVKVPSTTKNLDTLKSVKPVVITPTKKPIVQVVKVPEVTNGRVNNEQSRITLTEKKINLSIYDNGTIDGDTVSVYFDNKLVVNKKRLSGSPISLDLELDENISLHTLVVYAENLGSIPPNTALVILTTASGKRYELHSSATLEKNAALIFEYKPK